MLRLRSKKPDIPAQVHAALARVLDREIAGRIRAIERSRVHFTELPLVVSDLSALHEARMRLASTSGLNDVTALAHALADLAKSSRRSKVDAIGSGVELDADLLFALHHGLFPAERMFVIGGRKEGGRLILQRPYDVTGETSSHTAYTRADPEKIGRALQAMDRSGTRLVGWAHSHPGSGIASTHPSAIDRRQYASWIANYPDIVAIIMTEDGYMRIWGETAQTALPITVSGKGCRRIDHGLFQIEC